MFLLQRYTPQETECFLQEEETVWIPELEVKGIFFSSFLIFQGFYHQETAAFYFHESICSDRLIAYAEPPGFCGIKIEVVQRVFESAQCNTESTSVKLQERNISAEEILRVICLLSGNQLYVTQTRVKRKGYILQICFF